MKKKFSNYLFNFFGNLLITLKNLYYEINVFDIFNMLYFFFFTFLLHKKKLKC